MIIGSCTPSHRDCQPITTSTPLSLLLNPSPLCLRLPSPSASTPETWRFDHDACRTPDTDRWCCINRASHLISRRRGSAGHAVREHIGCVHGRPSIGRAKDRVSRDTLITQRERIVLGTIVSFSRHMQPLATGIGSSISAAAPESVMVQHRHRP